jgi:hypothetical protein
MMYSEDVVVVYMRDTQMHSVTMLESDLKYMEDLDAVDILYVMKFNREYYDALSQGFGAPSAAEDAPSAAEDAKGPEITAPRWPSSGTSWQPS